MRHIPRSAIIKAIGLTVFFAAALLLVQHSQLWTYLDPERFRPFMAGWGLFGPLLFILFYAAGLCLLVPSSVMSMLGAALFGLYMGFVYVWIGAVIGAGAAFLIARSLGREFAAALIGDRLRRFDHAFERNGFATVLYIRLLNMPFTYCNFGIGLTGVHFGQYLGATALGMIISLFTFVFLGSTLKEAWVTGNWMVLVSAKAMMVLALYAFSFFIPRILKRFKLIP